MMVRSGSPTNDGLIRYNPENDETLKYGRNYGITISEFSDGASFSTPNTLIFGGINGIATVSRNKRFLNHKPFAPSLHLLSISISGIDVPPVAAFRAEEEYRISPIQS